jgi:SAM-dependent methyltransferase
MKINFGSGPRHRPDGWMAVDINSNVNADVLLVENERFPWDDNSVDQIYSSHVFEHIWLDDTYGVLAEMHRVTRHGGQILTITPDIKSLVESLVNCNEQGRFGCSESKFSDQDWFANPEVNSWNPNDEWSISVVLAHLFSELVLEDDRIQKESYVGEALPHSEHRWNTYGSRLLKIIRSVFPNSILLGTNGVPPEILEQGYDIAVLDQPFEFIWTDPDSGFVWPTVNWFPNTCAVLSTVEKVEFE